jgi:hypothetical protein
MRALIALLVLGFLAGCVHAPPVRYPVPELNPAYPGGN